MREVVIEEPESCSKAGYNGTPEAGVVTAADLIQRMEQLASEPVDVTQKIAKTAKKSPKRKKLSLSSMVRKYPNFDMSAYPKVHKIRLNEKLWNTLERNDIERPKVLAKKKQVFDMLNADMDKLPVVKDAITQELTRRENRAIRGY